MWAWNRYYKQLPKVSKYQSNTRYPCIFVGLQVLPSNYSIAPTGTR